MLIVLCRKLGANLKRALLLFSDRERASEISDLLLPEGIECITRACQSQIRKILKECARFNPIATLVSEKSNSNLGVICRYIRESNPAMAILASFHKHNPALEKKLFNIGVDDIVYDRTPAGSIANRIVVRMKMRQKFFGSHTAIKKTIVDSASYQIHADGKTRHISKGLLDLLQYFLRHPARVISREEVVGTLWSDSIVDPKGKNLDVQVGKLRRLIEPNPKKPIIIRTVRGAGYVFDPNVTPSTH